MSLEALLTILGMAIVTFGIRAGGLLLADRLPRTGFVASWMKHLPGAVLASLVAPSLFSADPAGAIGLAEIGFYIKPAETIAAAATIGLYVLSRNLFAAMIGGVAVVFVARLLLGG
jgi:branched-subunit amino acid transport protein